MANRGQDYTLWSILGLSILSLLCGRRGMKAAFVLGRSLTRRQKAALGFVRGKSPCRATLKETLRVIDAQALADVLGSLGLEQGTGAQHIAIDGKTVPGHEASRGKGLEIPDALKLLERLDVKGKIVSGDAIFCQKSFTTKIIERGGDYVLPALRQDIETAFNEPVFPLRT